MGIGLGEAALILVIAFGVVGPDDLPKVTRTIAGWVRTIRQAMKELSGSLEQELDGGEMAAAAGACGAPLSERERIQRQVLASAAQEKAATVSEPR